MPHRIMLATQTNMPYTELLSTIRDMDMEGILWVGLSEPTAIRTPLLTLVARLESTDTLPEQLELSMVSTEATMVLVVQVMVFSVVEMEGTAAPGVWYPIKN